MQSEREVEPAAANMPATPTGRGSNPARSLEAATLALRAAGQLLDAARVEHERASMALERAVAEVMQSASTALPVTDAPPSDHLRKHRPGVLAKLDTDAELRAFVVARVDRMTFQGIVDAVASTFPPDRRVTRSTIHDWWKRDQAVKPQRRLRRTGKVHPRQSGRSRALPGQTG